MRSDEDGYIIVPNPNNPNQNVRAKLLDFDKVSGQDYEYKLRVDGTKIRLVLDVDTISRIIDPVTNRPAVNPKTREPVFNISWAVNKL
jgi:hypothetical protein